MKKRSITLKEMFKRYDYPCMDFEKISNGTIPDPYIKVDDLKCDHEYTLTYSEWRKIVTCLFEYMFKLLITGIPITLPSKLGIIQIKKRKATSIDWVVWRETGEVKHIQHAETNGYKPILKWARNNRFCVLKEKYNWKINFLKSTWRKYVVILKKDYSIINKYQDT